MYFSLLKYATLALCFCFVSFLSVYQLLNMLGRVKICETSSISFYFTLSKKLILHHLEPTLNRVYMRRGSKSSELLKVLSPIRMGTKSDWEVVVCSFCSFRSVASSCR